MAPVMFALIDAVEVSRAGRIAHGGVALSPNERLLAGYVRLADRMEGALLKDGPRAALAEMQAFAGLRDGGFRDGLEIVDIYEPQAPFILEELLTGLSSAVKKATGLPPVFEVHHDGHLIAVRTRKLLAKLRRISSDFPP